MATPKETILITGASSGLGLAFTKHFASLLTHTIIALDKQPFPSSIPQPPNLHFHHLDITSADEVQTLASHYASTRLTLILHCAGIRGLVPSVVAQEEEAGTHDAARTETMEVMDKETMMRTFEINTWGTFNLVRAFLPNLLLSCSGSGSTSTPRPRVVVLSSRMSSISANAAGGGYAYRASKAALNAVVRSFAIDVPQVGFLLLHPGRVETGLVAWKEEGAISVEESVGDCLRVLGRMEEEGWKSGRLVDRFGEEIAW